MRKVLFQEGKAAFNNIYIEVGAIKFDPEKTYPVSAGSIDSPPIGRASKLIRDGDEITGEIEWGPGTIPPDEDHYNLSLYCNELKTYSHGLCVEEATLRGFYVVPAKPATARVWEPDVRI